MRKVLVGLFLVLCYCSCDPCQESYFKQKAGGHRAFGLDGTYIFTYKVSDSLELCDTLRFERIRKSEFLITEFSSKDTVFFGEILKRKGLYFMNRPSGQKGWWHISAFRFSGDSLYNYGGLDCNSSYHEEIKGQKFFSDFQETETALYVNNSSAETYEAMEFSVMNGLRAGYRELDVEEDNLSEKIEPAKKADPAFLVYPNPVKTDLIIEAKADGKYFAEIIDMNGKTVRLEQFSESYFTLNVTQIPSGNYIARITGSGDGKQNNFKIVVQK